MMMSSTSVVVCPTGAVVSDTVLYSTTVHVYCTGRRSVVQDHQNMALTKLILTRLIITEKGEAIDTRKNGIAFS